MKSSALRNVSEKQIGTSRGRERLRPPTEKPIDPFIEKLNGWLSPKQVAETFGFSVLTVYSWKAKANTRAVPAYLFVKFNRKLFVRTDVLKAWIASQNEG